MSSLPRTRCWCCNGTGQVHREDSWLILDTSPSWYSVECMWTRCDICDGAGYIYPLQSVTCQECSGRGRIRIEYTLFHIFRVHHTVNCSACHGRGFARRKASKTTIGHTEVGVEQQRGTPSWHFEEADQEVPVRVIGHDLNSKPRLIRGG